MPWFNSLWFTRGTLVYFTHGDPAFRLTLNPFISILGSEYAYFWLAAVVSTVCYGYIAFRWLQEAGAQGDRLLSKDALAMGWYPAGKHFYYILRYLETGSRRLTFDSWLLYFFSHHHAPGDLFW